MADGARIEWHGDLAIEKWRAGAAAGLHDAVTLVHEASMAAAPKDTLDLVKSSGTDVDAAALEGSIYYDPDRGIKAIVRHEALRQGGSPKYLEKPLLANRAAALAAAAKQIRRALA